MQCQAGMRSIDGHGRNHVYLINAKRRSSWATPRAASHTHPYPTARPKASKSRAARRIILFPTFLPTKLHRVLHHERQGLGRSVPHAPSPRAMISILPRYHNVHDRTHPEYEKPIQDPRECRSLPDTEGAGHERGVTIQRPIDDSMPPYRPVLPHVVRFRNLSKKWSPHASINFTNR